MLLPWNVSIRYKATDCMSWHKKLLLHNGWKSRLKPWLSMKFTLNNDIIKSILPCVMKFMSS
jgi:hypothetical protein